MMPSPNLVQEQAFIRRRYLSWWDFYHAHTFLNRLLELEKEASKNEKVALTIAAVVSYCRPFSSNRGADGSPWSLPDALRSDFSREEHVTHEHMMELRNKAFAHSDQEMIGLEVAVVEVRGEKTLHPSSWSPMQPLSSSVSKRLQKMLEKLMQAVSQEWDDKFEQIKDELNVGDVF